MESYAFGMHARANRLPDFPKIPTGSLIPDNSALMGSSWLQQRPLITQHMFGMHSRANCSAIRPNMRMGCALPDLIWLATGCSQPPMTALHACGIFELDRPSPDRLAMAAMSGLPDSVLMRGVLRRHLATVRRDYGTPVPASRCQSPLSMAAPC